MYPRIFHIYGPIWVQSYGLMIVLGLILFVFLTYYHPLRSKLLSDDKFFQMFSWGIIGGLVGGRLFVLLTEWHAFSWYEIFLPWIGGFGILGCIAGVISALTFFFYLHQLSMMAIFDLISLYAPLLQAVSRVGCFLAGCCYGLPHNGLCSITYTHLDSFAPLFTPLHPAQLYTALASFGVFLLLFFFAKNRFSFSGSLFFVYLMLESGARFVTDYWRGDRMPAPLFSVAQWIALFLFFFAGIGLYLNARYGNKRSYDL